jgi:raffinose/stachyose/melibiose transport system permease protein
MTTVTDTQPTDRKIDTGAPSRRHRVGRRRPGGWPRRIGLGVVALAMLVPIYILVISAFKPQQEILDNPLGIPWDQLTVQFLIDAVTSETFNVVRAYGITALFVVLVCVFTVLFAAPAAYVIARGRSRWHVALLLFFVAGTFIPSQAILIPVIYVLRWLGLMGTVPGFIAFEVAGNMAITLFLCTAYVRTIPREIDEAAALDGAGRLRTFWSTIFPLMRPVVATVVILNALGTWNNFVGPQVILGPGSDIYTVQTGVFAAVGQYTTNYTVMFPTLLLTIAPALIFFVIMQRHIIGGLVAGAAKG